MLTGLLLLGVPVSPGVRAQQQGAGAGAASSALSVTDGVDPDPTTVSPDTLPAEEGTEPLPPTAVFPPRTNCGNPPDVQLAARPVPLTPELAALRSEYLKGLCYEAMGQAEIAQTVFRQGLEQTSAIPALWRLNLLRLQMASDDPAAALVTLNALLSDRPGKTYVDRVRRLLTAKGASPTPPADDVWFAYLKTYLASVKPTVEDDGLLVQLLPLAQRYGDKVALGAAAVALWSNPEDEKAAVHWATVMDSMEKQGMAPPEGVDYQRRAQRLFKLGLHGRLTRELETARLPRMEPSTAKALGRLYFRSLIRSKALQHAAVQIYSDSVARRFAFDRRQQLVWGTRIQIRRSKMGPALKLVAELEERSPQDESLADLFYQIADYNRRRQNTVTLRHWSARLVSEFPVSPEAAGAYWMVIWDAYKHGDLDTASEWIDKAISANTPFHPADQARLYYWKGRIQMLRGRRQSGLDTWQFLQERWPYGYYAAMAELSASGKPLKLHNGDTPERPLPAPPMPTLSALWSVKPFPQALFLFSVGENALATELLKKAVTQPMSPEAVDEAGALFYYLQRHHLQLRLIANHQLDILRRSSVAQTTLWLHAFPRPHWDLVWKAAEHSKLDPYFVLAIMREESRFHTGADSTAGAKGLMQLMPGTAQAVAHRNGLPFKEDTLNQPESNISIGALYLKRVLSRFSENPVYAAAAYNAGPSAVRRWLRRMSSLPLDVFVERIPYAETQSYVKRVFLSYQVYSKLYR